MIGAQQSYPGIYAEESKESELHEMLEPLELFLRGRLVTSPAGT